MNDVFEAIDRELKMFRMMDLSSLFITRLISKTGIASLYSVGCLKSKRNSGSVL